jgi:hypothetical protein
MGNFFGTCLSVGDVNAFSTVANACEANKRVVYLRDAAGHVIGRKLLVLTRGGRIVGFRSYGSRYWVSSIDALAGKGGVPAWVTVALDAFCRSLADRCGATLHPLTEESMKADPAAGAKLALFARWYDDGHEPFDEAWLAHAPEALRADVRANGAAAGRLLQRLALGEEAAVGAAGVLAWLGDEALGIVRDALGDQAGISDDVRKPLAHFLSQWSGGERVRRRARLAMTGEPSDDPAVEGRKQRSRSPKSRRSPARG